MALFEDEEPMASLDSSMDLNEEIDENDAW
jgi:hypothetical protein